MSNKEIKCSLPFIFLVLSFMTLFFCSCTEYKKQLLSYQEIQYRDNFLKNNLVFEELKYMACEDNHIAQVKKEGYEQLPKENGRIIINKGMSESRFKKYNELFQKLGIDYGIQKTHSKLCGVRFDYGLQKGYFYSSVTPSDVHASFYECSVSMFNEEKKVGICYVAIQKNWYLYYYEQ